MPPQEQNLDDVTRFVVSVPAGEFIFREHDAGAELYVIKEGQVELLKARGLEERQVEVLEVGDFFGESSLLDGEPREVSARAVTATQVIRIDAATFGQLVGESPQIAVHLLRKRSRRVREQLEAEQRAAMAAARAAQVAAKSAPPKAPKPIPTGEPVLVHAASGTRFPLAGKAEFLVGRPERGGVPPDLDLSALDTERTLSRRHARFFRHGDRMYVREDTPTTNGTFVNATRVAPGTEVPLADGDRVRLGRVELVIHWE